MDKSIETCGICAAKLVLGEQAAICVGELDSVRGYNIYHLACAEGHQEYIPLSISVEGTNAHEVQEVMLALIEQTKLLLRSRFSTLSMVDKNDVEAKLSLLHAVKIVFCYAHKDEVFLRKLKTHLAPLQRQGLIDVWYDRNISAGTEWEQEIGVHLNNADILLLLVSPDFMASDYCYGKEMQQAIERHKRGEVCAIPIILRPCDWMRTPLGKLQALPKDGKPVTRWQDRDNAYLDIALGVRKEVEEVTNKHSK